MSDVVLFDQLLPSIDGILSQQFQPGLADLNSQVSDNFTVPPSETWTIKTVKANGQYTVDGNTATTANVSFYNTVPLSNPAVPEEIAIQTFNDVPIVDPGNTGDFTLDLPDPGITLMTGGYWVSVQANLDSNFNITQGSLSSAWFWGVIPDQGGNDAAFRNPPNGLDTGAVTWTPTSTLLFVPTEFVDQSFLLSGVRVIAPPCLHEETLVKVVENGKTIEKPIKEIVANDYVEDYKGQSIKVAYNIVFSPKVDSFVHVPANSIEPGMPTADLHIRKFHPILYRGREIDPLKLAKKKRIGHLIKEVKIPGPLTTVYSLCTEDRTFIMMQGLAVATWQQNDWEANHSKSNKFVWSKQ